MDEEAQVAAAAEKRLGTGRFVVEEVCAGTVGGPSACAAIPSSGGRLRIRWKQFSARYVPLVAWCLVWDALLVVCCSALHASNAAWPAFVFLLLNAFLVGAVTFAALLIVLDRTELTLAAGRLRVRQGRLRMRRRVDVDSSAVRRLRVVAGQGRHALLAVLDDGNEVELVRHLAELDEAEFLVGRLTRALRLAIRAPLG